MIVYCAPLLTVSKVSMWRSVLRVVCGLGWRGPLALGVWLVALHGKRSQRAKKAGRW